MTVIVLGLGGLVVVLWLVNRGRQNKQPTPSPVDGVENAKDATNKTASVVALEETSWPKLGD
jgi:hypothetical protein